MSMKTDILKQAQAQLLGSLAKSGMILPIDALSS